MRAIRYGRFGGDEELHWGELSMPGSSEGEGLVEMPMASHADPR
jgi:hypothetical protein